MTLRAFPLGASELIGPRCRSCGKRLALFLMGHDMTVCARFHAEAEQGYRLGEQSTRRRETKQYDMLQMAPPALKLNYVGPKRHRLLVVPEPALALRVDPVPEKECPTCAAALPVFRRLAHAQHYAHEGQGRRAPPVDEPAGG